MKVEYFLTLLTIIIGGFVAYVARSQFILAKEKFKLDLFEKRFEIYKGVDLFLLYINREAIVTFERYAQFYRDTQNYVFLFEDDIKYYLILIEKNALELLKINKKPSAQKDFDREEELLTWFTNQRDAKPSPLIVAFSPYLKFKKWQ